MHLLELPVELLQGIVEHLVDERDISSLSRTSWSLFSTVISHLYASNHFHHHGSAVTWAIEAGRPETIRRALSVGVDLVQLRHVTLAAELGQADLLNTLLEGKLKHGGFESMETDEDDRCPLYVAAKAAQYDTVKILLNTGRIGTEAWSRYDRTPLHIAASYGNPRLVRLLLDYGANLMAMDKFGRTPLGYACAPDHYFSRARQTASREDYVETVRVIVEYGADVRFREMNNFTPFHSAVRYGYCDVVELLAANGADVNTRDRRGHTPLQTASLECGTLEMTKLLVRTGARVSATNFHGRNSLYMSLKTREPAQVAEFLFAQGVEMTRDLEGNTPLHYAKVSSDLVEVFLAHGADINDLNLRRETLLHLASSDPSRASLVGMLIERGADINLKDIQGQTPLFLAVRCSSLKAMEVLLEHGADPNCLPNSGLSMIQMAISRRSADQTDLLLRFGADLGKFNEQGRSAMHFCALFGHLKLMEIMIQHGASINEPDEHGRTPLMEAVVGHSIKAVDFLLNHGANVYAVDEDGQTALHLLTAVHGAKWTDIIQLLVRHGADMEALDKEGRSPLSILRSEADDVVVELFYHRNPNHDASFDL
jgi:ankyrin repeat protein